MKKIWITADKPVGFSCPVGNGEFLHVAITQEMIDKKKSVEVPDNDFFNGKIREKLISQAMPPKRAADPVKTSPKKEDTA